MTTPPGVDQESPEQPTSPDTTPPSGLGVYERPERSRVSLPVILVLLILAIITVIIIWQLWL